jgi:hypothetical protein
MEVMEASCFLFWETQLDKRGEDCEMGGYLFVEEREERRGAHRTGVLP